VQEPEGSSPHSQQLATGPYPEPVESNPHPPANLRKIPSEPILPSTPWSSEWSLLFGLSHWLILFKRMISAYTEKHTKPINENIYLLILMTAGTYIYHWFGFKGLINAKAFRRKSQCKYCTTTTTMKIWHKEMLVAISFNLVCNNV
jgi:hypothetical protein